MSSDNELIYKLALARTRNVSVEIIRMMYERDITPYDFFTMTTSALTEALSLSSGTRFDQMIRDEALAEAKQELKLMERHHISGHFILDPTYPVRLFETPDAPIFLYQLGEADIDGRHFASVVGTRKPTPYGIDFCRRLVGDLSPYFDDLCIVSGLAYGIDAAAHQAALDNNVTTIAVVAHGLNMIYPAPHRDLARRILKSGGAIVTEYPFDTVPYRQRFLERNRIVAGLSDVTVVVESDLKGGAMSTANTAFSYNRDVMALPGKISDKLSTGCNHLIRKEKAHLITSGADLIELTGWKPLDLKIDTSKRNLFPELEGDYRLVYETLKYSEIPMQIDRLHIATGLPVAKLMSILGELEFDGIIIRHPGNRYSPA